MNEPQAITLSDQNCPKLYPKQVVIIYGVYCLPYTIITPGQKALLDRVMTGGDANWVKTPVKDKNNQFLIKPEDTYWADFRLKNEVSEGKCSQDDADVVELVYKGKIDYIWDEAE